MSEQVLENLPVLWLSIGALESPAQQSGGHSQPKAHGRSAAQGPEVLRRLNFHKFIFANGYTVLLRHATTFPAPRWPIIGGSPSTYLPDQHQRRCRQVETRRYRTGTWLCYPVSHPLLWKYHMRK